MRLRAAHVRVSTTIKAMRDGTSRTENMGNLGQCMSPVLARSSLVEATINVCFELPAYHPPPLAFSRIRWPWRELPMAITVCPVTLHFAAEIGDVDLSRSLEPTDLTAIKDAFTAYAVLIFPDQH